MPQSKIRSETFKWIFGAMSLISFVFLIAAVTFFSSNSSGSSLKFVLIPVSLIIFIAFSYLTIKEENLYRNSVIAVVCEEFGEILDVESQPQQFKRGDDIFGATVTKSKHAADFIASFNMPTIQKSFFVQTDSALAILNNAFTGNSPSNLQTIDFPSLKSKFVTQTSDPDFLRRLLKDGKIQTEIEKYPSDWGKFIRIVFENGRFEMQWHIDPGQDIAEGLRTILPTTFLFHEKIKTLLRN